MHGKHYFALAAAIGALGLLLNQTALSAVGDWDTRYGDGGYFVPPADARFIHALVDGRFLYGRPGGYSRTDLDGRPDMSFGDRGIARLPGEIIQVQAIRTLRDHRTVLAVHARGPYAQLTDALIRLDADGQVDTSFGDGGILSFWSTPGEVPQSWIVDDIEEQPDGKLLVLRSKRNGKAYGALEIELWRLLDSGDVDESFGGEGRIRDFQGLDYFWSVGVLQLLLNGNIDVQNGGGDNLIIEGPAYPVSHVDGDYPWWGIEQLLGDGGMLASRVIWNGPGGPASSRIARLQADGRLDTTFGGQGTGYLELTSSDFRYASGNLLTSPGDELLFLRTLDSDDDVGAISRYHLSGSGAGTLDTRFGVAGRQLLPESINPALAATQLDGSVILNIGGKYIRLLGTLTRSPGIIGAAGPESIEVDEAAGELVVRILRSAGDAPTSVAYATVPRSDGSSKAAEGIDYLPVAGVLEWAEADRTDRTIRISLLRDPGTEPPKQFTIELTPIAGGAMLAAQTLYVTLYDRLPVGIATPASAPEGPAELDSGGGSLDAATLLLLLVGVAFARNRHRRPGRPLRGQASLGPGTGLPGLCYSA